MAKASQGTAVDLTGVTDAVDTRDFDLQPHLINLMWDEPFYSKVLRGITKKKGREVSTAGVLVKDGNAQLFWNPAFFNKIVDEGGPQKVKGLMIHECLHLVFEHCTERKHEPHIIWNYATDCAINSLIPRALLPDGGIVPGQGFTELTAEQKEKMPQEVQDRYERMSAFIEALPLGLSSEEYFALFMQDKQIKEDLQGQEGQGGMPGGDGIPGPLDDHGGWGEMTDEERELVKGKIKQAVTDAARECDSKGGWGSVSSDARAQIRAMINKEIPWQAVLKKFVGFSRRAQRRTSWNKVNKKLPMLVPAGRKTYTASIAVYIDQSGSVGDESLELLFGTLADLAGRVEFTCYHFDTSVDLDSETTWRKGRVPPVHRTRGGGTCFKAPSVHANKNKHRFDGYIILTDGYAPDPGPSRVKRGWVITPGDELQFKAGARDFVINMKEPKRNAA
jgi:predicted metal-dependent peptidase